MNIENHCFNATPPGQRDAVSCVTLSMALAAIEQARREEREACASLCDSLRTVIIDGALVPAMPSHCAAAIRVRKP